MRLCVLPFSSVLVLTTLVLVGFHLSICDAREPDVMIDLWTALPAGETVKNTGEALPTRPDEKPPATRIKDITFPRLFIYQPPKEKRNGTAVIVFPGGGYNYVVMDKEGSEVADWLNPLGVTVFVAHYRTKRTKSEPDSWIRPLEDGQRAVSLVRSRAEEWGVSPKQIGVLGFSAGGQCAALVTTRFSERQYKAVDEIDQVSCRPDFSLLLYPWQLVDGEGELRDFVTINAKTPPTFLAHTHDDPITSLSSIEFYKRLKHHKIPAAMHIYSNGGHGYGMRPVEGSDVDTWRDRATEWLTLHGYLSGS
jgi:acetyl esterase/lipase